MVSKLSQQELDNNVPLEASWHNDYKDTAWVKIRGLNSELTEGDVLCVFSQFGEIDDLNLVRDRATGRIIVCLIKYEQFRSAWLTVDNFNGVELVGQRISVDHHRESIKRQKRGEPELSLEDKLERVQPGRAYQQQEALGEVSLSRGVDLYAAAAAAAAANKDEARSWKLEDANAASLEKKHKKEKKERKEKKKDKKKKKREREQ